MKKNKFIFFILIIMSLYSLNVLAQDNKEKIGSDELSKTGINYYNYSDKDKVNFEVSIWGYVKSPGKYLIPSGTTFIDLISLSGGPQNEAFLNNIRIIRLKNDSLNIKEDKVMMLNYEDYLSEDLIQNPKKNNPTLYPGDVILIPGGRIATLRDNISLILSILTALTSITVLMVTIFKK